MVEAVPTEDPIMISGGLEDKPPLHPGVPILLLRAENHLSGVIAGALAPSASRSVVNPNVFFLQIDLTSTIFMYASAHKWCIPFRTTHN
jgi:hypothetical protein